MSKRKLRNDYNQNKNHLPNDKFPFWSIPIGELLHNLNSATIIIACYILTAEIAKHFFFKKGKVVPQSEME